MNVEYSEWLSAKHALDSAKKKELELRNAIVGSFTDEKTPFGTVKKYKDGCKITIGLGLRNTLDEAVLDTIWDDLKDTDKNCVKYKPSLVAKELKEVEDNSKIWEAITTKPSQPTLKIEEDES